MKWIFKASLQAGLGSMPASVADPIYHGLQYLNREIPTDLQTAAIHQGSRFTSGKTTQPKIVGATDCGIGFRLVSDSSLVIIAPILGFEQFTPSM
jgi:hypothetical protein